MKALLASLPFLVAVRLFPWLLNVTCSDAAKRRFMQSATIWRGGGF